MNKVHVKTGDEVVVINGKYHGQKGKVLAVSPAEGKVIVEGLNMVKKHVKPRKMGDPGGIIEAEGAIYACKVMPVCPKCGKPRREGDCGCPTKEIDPRLAPLQKILEQMKKENKN